LVVVKVEDLVCLHTTDNTGDVYGWMTFLTGWAFWLPH